MNQYLSAIVKNRGSPALANDPAEARSRASNRDRRWAAALPWSLLAGFLILLVILLGDRLLPARSLSIATVVTDRQSADSDPGISQAVVSPADTDTPLAPVPALAPLLFQASGWIEPDPYPVLATALVGGVIESVAVLEGETVEHGQLLAALIDDDARLDLETAKSRFTSLEAQAAAQGMETEIAEAELASLEKLVAAAMARRNEAADLADRLKRMDAGAVSDKDVAQASLEFLTREAEVEALAITELELKAKLIQQQNLASDSAARTAEAETEVARRQLALDRTRITSPIDGRVLRLLAVPGQKKMLDMDHPESATVAVLYDPDSLQARIDVPLAEAAKLFKGQAVRLRSELLPDRVFGGQVTRIVGEADLQRNTLQVKVSIENPDGRLRPEMLCRAEFLAIARNLSPAAAGIRRATSTSLAAAEGRVRVFVPNAALDTDSTSADSVEATVWRVDSSGLRIERQPITLGRERREDHRLVLDGLKPGDRVVLVPPPDLENGDRFRPANPKSSSET
jgi:multidrug efflux pump subunit AcrA (membrane-fusion protein)